jgi:hypothetical protein
MGKYGEKDACCAWGFELTSSGRGIAAVELAADILK